MFFSRYRVQPIPVPGLILSLLGLGFSLVMALDAAPEALCLNSGCALVQDFKIFGFSPWWASAGAFLLLVLLCGLRMRYPAKILASLFLLGDSFFLALMFFIAPCANCLLAGLLIFCAWASLRLERRFLNTPRRILSGALGCFWGLLFILNLSLALEELIPDWKLGSNPEPQKLAIFFSPSCPACREAIKTFAGQADFFPVADVEEDYAFIAELAAKTAAGIPLAEALSAQTDARAQGNYSPPAQDWLEGNLSRIRVMRNRATLLRLKQTSLPVLIFEGLPRSWSRPWENAPQENTPQENTVETPAQESASAQEPILDQAPPISPEHNPDLPLDLHDPLACGPETSAPCP